MMPGLQELLRNGSGTCPYSTNSTDGRTGDNVMSGLISSSKSIVRRGAKHGEKQNSWGGHGHWSCTKRVEKIHLGACKTRISSMPPLACHTCFMRRTGRCLDSVMRLSWFSPWYGRESLPSTGSCVPA